MGEGEQYNRNSLGVNVSSFDVFVSYLFITRIEIDTCNPQEEIT